MASTSGQQVGVDGAYGGWIAVWEEAGDLVSAVYANPSALCSAHAEATVIAVDIPIGLPDAGRRASDVEARRFVGGKRASSIFPTPVRGILSATSQAEASIRHRAIDGRGFGVQSFGILPKIRDWNALLVGNVELGNRVYEIHPEVSFAALNGGAGLCESKKKPEGFERRKALLGEAFDMPQVLRLLDRHPRRLASRDDVLDALVALWSAKRIACGVSRHLPSVPTKDATGLTMAIHF